MPLNSHVECLRVAHQLGGYNWRFDIVYAAMNSHVECLHVAHGVGGAMGISCEYAATNSHVECLRVAHELGELQSEFM